MTTSPARSLSLRAAFLFGLAVSALGCGAGSTLGEARQAWTQTKTTCGTYHYAISTSSFSGFNSKTTIEITGDEPTARLYEEFHYVPASDGSVSTKVVDKTWTETGATVGTHPEGQAGKTMEALYDDCGHDVEPQDRAKNNVKIQSDPRGVLQECWYVPPQCADDCKMGISVEDFACGALPVPTAS